MINPKMPVVTCLTVTNGRVNQTKNAIRHFINQTYRRKNMVLLSQGTEDQNNQIRQHVNSLSRSDILFLTASPKMSLGAMRNASVELATGDIMCQWDDDDHYHPERISTQYSVLASDSNNIASVYCDFIKYFEDSGVAYWCDWSGEPLLSHKFLCGSAMFHKKTFHLYSNFYPESGDQCHVEEDLNVIEKMSYKGELGKVFAGHQYIYVFHGANTYDLNHHQLTLDTTWGKKVYTNDQLIEQKRLLETTFSLAMLDKPISVRSLEGEAFKYMPKGIGHEV